MTSTLSAHRHIKVQTKDELIFLSGGNVTFVLNREEAARLRAELVAWLDQRVSDD